MFFQFLIGIEKTFTTSKNETAKQLKSIRESQNIDPLKRRIGLVF
jgi:hypothetical protein